MNFRNVIYINILLVFILSLLQPSEWYMMLLTVAQLIFVPFVLYLITNHRHGKFEKLLASYMLIASIAVCLIPFMENRVITIILAVIYLFFTFVVALYGVRRFLNRGFIHFEECLIDLGLIFLAVGGMWFFAFQANLDTGFSPIITWLTSIHFHYAAFLFLVSFGLLGRLLKVGKWYVITGMFIIVSPWLVALGITYSGFLEVVSVIFYILGIYSAILLSIQAQITHKIQRFCIIVSFGSLGLTILFSFAYAFGNYTGLYAISIDHMIATHGVLNTVLFALFGLIGWSIHIPKTKEKKPIFPVSAIRGSFVVDEKVLEGKTGSALYNGLVDNMRGYQAINTVSIPTVVDFYENTNSYRLFAQVRWSKWFLPFAALYKLLSKITKQLNLPLSSNRMEMTGDIVSVNDETDGRDNVRAWIRKVNGETVFVALYSEHINHGRTYMNIALPLPGATMIGILDLKQIERTLRLTSKRDSVDSIESGIYLDIHGNLLKLPLEEQFDVKEVGEGNLRAKHQMWIFSLPFLKIEYDIQKKSGDV